MSEQYRAEREARAWQNKIEPQQFDGSDELCLSNSEPHRPPRLTAGDRKALEAEAWYRDYMKLKAAQGV